jgi:TonB family protein
MESLNQRHSKRLITLELGSPDFRSNLGTAPGPVELSSEGELGLWRDVFVRQGVPWYRFFQSVLLHAGAISLVWMVSLAWIRQQNVLAHPVFDRASLVTYSPEEYLPPLDTGVSDSPPAQKGDPEYAKQPILSVPREADNRTQTIVTPPDLRLDRDVPLPNIIAMGSPVPAVPLEATRAPMVRMAALETPVVAPAPELDASGNRALRNGFTSEVIAPPPEIAPHHSRGIAGPDSAVVEPPPELPRSAKGQIGAINIGPSEVVAPSPQLPVGAQHPRAARGTGGLMGGGVEPVGPPPSVNGVSATRTAGRLIALGIHPITPTGPVVAPQGNRRGTFAATPKGKPGASGTPDLAGPAGAVKGSGGGADGGNGGSNRRSDRSLPGGLHVGAADSSSVAQIATDGGKGASRNGAGDERMMASVTAPRVSGNPHAASPVSEDKVTEVDRQVFRGKRFYSMTLNMPNLNSATGSWVIRFAELKASQQGGELIRPEPTQKSDPGYPSELREANAQGVVTLYAVIHSDGSVGDIRVLSSPDDRLDPFAASALARWKFLPATKDGKPVALEAVVMIPFRVRKSSF